MLRELFIHGCVVIALFFLVGSFFRRFQLQSTIRVNLFLGTLLGLIGSFFMFFSVHITEYLMLDLRHVAVIIAALYGGPLSTIITASIIIFSRIMLFPVSYSTYASSITLIIITLLVIFVSKLKTSQLKKAILMNVCSTASFSIMFVFILFHFGIKDTFFDLIFLEYIPTSLIGGALAVYLANYIVSSNRSLQNLEKQAQFDYLTGLKNVRQFHLLLEAKLKKAKETHRYLALLFIDIDRFKIINDTYGHPAGDEVLRALGRVLNQSNNYEESIFRNGGEEFSIIIPDVNKQRAVDFAEKIRKKVEQHIFYLPDGVQIHITISVGIAFSDQNKTISEITNQADKALYNAKNSGRNKVNTA